MGNLFVSQDIVKPHLFATDSTLMSAKGKFWHVSSMKKRIVPCPGIDIDARWGYSHTKEGGYLDTNFTRYVILILLLSLYLW